MGCQQSHLSNITPTPISIVDASFFKPTNNSIRTLLQHHSLTPKIFMSVDCLIDSLAEDYTNDVVIRENDFNALQEGLGKLKLDPRIFVLGARKDGVKYGSRVKFFQKYEDLPQMIDRYDQNHQQSLKQTRSVEVRILKDFKSQAQSHLFIFEQTLKAKGITYELYNTFNELQKSQTSSSILVVDYRFHRAAITLNLKSKVICYCDLSPQETYDPYVFFITNNFQEIINEILLFKKLTQPVLPISKIFLCSTSPSFMRYSQIFQNFALKVKAYSNVSQLIKTTRLYFSVMIVCPSQELQNIQKKIKEEGCQFRIRALPISPQTQPTAIGLRRILREVKRGYLMQRTSSRVVDIIDKYHSSSKFQQIKKQLQNNNIAYKCYPSIMSYCKTLTFISPVIICNFDDRLLLHRFLSQVKIRSKVIIFCNRSKITQQLTHDQRWSFVSSHFGKIIKHIRTHHVLFPLIVDQQIGKKMPHAKKDDEKNKQHRVSALKWVEQGNNQHKNQQFIITNKGDASQRMRRESCEKIVDLIKLQGNPLENYEKFRKDLIQSINTLRKQYKLNILQKDFTKMIDEFGEANLHQLALRSRRFMGEQKDMGIGLNNTLKSLQKATESQEYKACKYAIFLLCLNFLNFYQIVPSQSNHLSCYTNQLIIDQCEVGSILLPKNFLAMRQEGTVQHIPNCVKLELDLNYSLLSSPQIQIAPYFLYEGRYIFAPYTQLQITQIDNQNVEKVIHIQLIPAQNTFIKKYIESTFKSNDISHLFKQQLANQTKSHLIDHQYHRQIQINLLRLDALTQSKNSSSLSNAILLQRQLIHSQEQSQNFNSKLLTELKFELITYLSLQNSPQVIDLISQIKDNSPSPYIKRQCGAMLNRLRRALQQGNGRKDGEVVHKTNKCIELKEEMEKESDGEEEEGVVEHGAQFQNIFQCLQLDEEEGFAQQFT